MRTTCILLAVTGLTASCLYGAEPLEITDPKVDVFGNVAIVTFYADSIVTYGTEVKSGSLRGTLVFARTKDGWKIVHEHSSQYSES